MEKIGIGMIVKAVGLKGEVKVYGYSGSKESFSGLERVFAGEDEYVVESVRFLRENVILKLSGISDRTAAEGLKGREIFISDTMLPKLPEGTYYIRDLIGFSVIQETGAILGRLGDVIQGSAQDLYEVEMENGKKALIPAVEEFILAIDTGNKSITVKLIEGLIP